MPEWLEVVILGVVEGITEFLPISSTGHLLLVEQWLSRRQSDAFLVIIQGGAALAVLLAFKERVSQLLRERHTAAARDYVLKLLAAFVITAIGGLALEALNFELPDTAAPVGLALLIGGILFLLVERLVRSHSRETVTWTLAVAIGVAQLVAAVFPGTSRSGATILIALAMGLSRSVAVEFTFLLGVPTLLAAGALKYVGAVRHGEGGLAPDMLLLGSAVSAVTAFIAVRWLLRYVQTHTFDAFGWYRIVLGAAVLLPLLLR